MNNIERGNFLKLFIRGGYVLDFTTSEFDVFTLESVGIPLCQHYKLSKGKSLTAFLQEADSGIADKLIFDLFEYYENNYGNFSRETMPNEFGEVALDGGVNYLPIYQKCRSIADKYSPVGQYTNVAANNIKEAFSSEYIDKQINLMLSMQTENPTEAIGKAKELIESCCKAILENHSIEYDKNWDVPRLTDETVKLLKITPKHIDDNLPGANSIKAILGNLRAIATHIAELRNPYGSGHGKSPNYKGLEERHAKLAVGAAITLTIFLWDSHLRLERNNEV